MPLSRRFTIAAILLAPVAMLFTFFLVPAKAVQPRTAPEPVSNPVGRPANNFRWEGVASCAAASCHGSLEKSATPLQSAVTVWTQKDPHARSYFTLRSESSRKMLAALRQLPSVAQAKPETDPLCLKCHATGVSEEWRGSKFDPSEGVGCENCHGAAGKWKAMHDLPSWQTLPDAEKTSYGMRPLRDPVVRADVCATCHQGSPDREVTHDLIAAGHPALYLDITPQNYRLPHHWDKAIDRRQPDFAARLWVSGQIIGVRMSMENLASSAKNPNKAWPEFSEYDCLSCHHTAQQRPRPG